MMAWPATRCRCPQCREDTKRLWEEWRDATLDRVVQEPATMNSRNSADFPSICIAQPATFYRDDKDPGWRAALIVSALLWSPLLLLVVFVAWRGATP